MNVPAVYGAEAQGASLEAAAVYAYYSRVIDAPTAVWRGPQAWLWRKALNAQLRVRALRFEAAHDGEFNHWHSPEGMAERIAAAEVAAAQTLSVARAASGLTH